MISSQTKELKRGSLVRANFDLENFSLLPNKEKKDFGVCIETTKQYPSSGKVVLYNIYFFNGGFTLWLTCEELIIVSI